MRILAIETSCDETAVALIDAKGDFGSTFSYTVLGNSLLSQAKQHAEYGGVFPNVAKREHQRALVPVLGEVFRQAGLLDAPADMQESTIVEVEHILEREPELFTHMSQFLRSTGKPPVDCIAVTHGPGLEPALWVGINFAKALALAWNLPLVAVNHMEGHIAMSALGSQRDDLATENVSCEFPLLSLLISGGHTELVLSREWMHYEMLGATRDDAVGEAFDKVARLMGLPYPGGPEISRLASEAREQALPHTIVLPRPMIDAPNYDFSFAGLKTAVRRTVEEHQPLSDAMRHDIAREFEDAAADVLISKTLRAIDEYDVRTVVVGGGVSANTHIRERLHETIQAHGTEMALLIPPPIFATDNALMIALAAYFHATKGEFQDPAQLVARGNLSLA